MTIVEELRAYFVVKEKNRVAIENRDRYAETVASTQTEIDRLGFALRNRTGKNIPVRYIKVDQCLVRITEAAVEIIKVETE